MARDYHTLGDLQGRLTHLEVRCRRCERHGRLRLARLIAEHGPAMGLPHLRHVLAGDCPHRDAREAERCNVFYPQLVKPVLGRDYEE